MTPTAHRNFKDQLYAQLARPVRALANAHRLELKGDSMRKIAAQRAKLDAAKKT